jgi:hypothetical protein
LEARFLGFSFQTISRPLPGHGRRRQPLLACTSVILLVNPFLPLVQDMQVLDHFESFWIIYADEFPNVPAESG